MSETQPDAPKKVWDIDYARKVLLNYPCYHERLGGVEKLEITEIGDGNLNYIYVVAGVKETIVLKIVCPSIEHSLSFSHTGSAFCSRLTRVGYVDETSILRVQRARRRVQSLPAARP